MQQEAIYKCHACEHYYHVCCMGTPDATTITRQQKYSATCFQFQMAGKMAKEAKEDQRVEEGKAKGQANPFKPHLRSRGTGGDTSSNRERSTCKENTVQHELLIDDVMGFCDDPHAP